MKKLRRQFLYSAPGDVGGGADEAAETVEATESAETTDTDETEETAEITETETSETTETEETTEEAAKPTVENQLAELAEKNRLLSEQVEALKPKEEAKPAETIYDRAKAKADADFDAGLITSAEYERTFENYKEEFRAEEQDQRLFEASKPVHIETARKVFKENALPESIAEPFINQMAALTPKDRDNQQYQGAAKITALGVRAWQILQDPAKAAQLIALMDGTAAPAEVDEAPLDAGKHVAPVTGGTKPTNGSVIAKVKQNAKNKAYLEGDWKESHGRDATAADIAAMLKDGTLEPVS